MRRLPWLICFVLIASQFVGPAQSQIVKFQDCVVDVEIWILPNCSLETRDGHLYVSKRYLKLFFPTTKNQLASRLLPGAGWAYFNRTGLVIVEHVAQMDNGASQFHNGLVRVVLNGKWGLANSYGQAVVPFEYDGMYEYDKTHKRWEVCTGCHVVSSGEYSRFEGGNWFWLDRLGRIMPESDHHARG